ncbi:hypothetical protein [Streptomyces sp. NPDC001070]
MSDHYDLLLAVDRQAEMPPAPVSAGWESWGCPWAVLAGGGASHAFAGAEVSLPVPAVDRPQLDGGVPWSPTVRACVHEDVYGVKPEAVEWVLRQATTQGWAGFVRGPAPDDVRHVVRRQDGFGLVDGRTARKQIRAARS